MNLTQLKKEKKLSTKECAYYILATSPILRLTERLIFSGSTKAMRNAIPKIVVLKKLFSFTIIILYITLSFTRYINAIIFSVIRNKQKI